MKKLNQCLSLIALGLSLSHVAAQAAPVAVQKSVGNKIYVHLMPWFEAKDFSGYWGSHWTMANRNPDKIDGAGRREIAAYDYPLIGPYSSSDPAVIEYQLLLMKLSGVDGVMIDWPGTTNAFDYVRNRQNSEAVIGKIVKVGLEFAVVYEDNNLTLANLGDKVGQARNDMAYLRDNYFNRPEYIKINNQPLLLDFGPQTLQSPGEWSNAFSVLPTKPYFLTLWYEHAEGGANSQGEFAWVYQDGTPFLSHLTNFYQNAQDYGLKMGVAAPGFNPFYAAGGWGSNAFVVEHNGLNTFKATFDLALSKNSPRIQIATWNDYGEGTDIEPTREFGYGFLTYMQQRLGVNLGQADLELVNELFNQRKRFAGNGAEQARLDNVFNYMVSLQMGSARSLLNGSTPPPPPPDPGTGVATVYQHCDYSGYGVALKEGSYNQTQLSALGVAGHDVSSLRVQQGYQVQMFGNPDFTGKALSKSGDDNCLVDDGFNDTLASLVVSKAGGAWSTQIEAEDYVRMSGVQTEAASEGGRNVGWLDGGDWMVWNLNTPSAGNYKVDYRVASAVGGGAIRLENAGASPIYATIGVPNTGGWQNWQTISHVVALPAGQQQIAIYVPTGGYNINWLKLTKQ
ncbi:MAG: carbohydrate-binding protein [Pseudomonadota bacterium]